MKLIVTVLFALLISSFSYGQSCCSSGVPIASNIGFQSEGKNILQTTIGWSHNRLGSLYAQNEQLSDNNRLRITNSYIARASYGFSDHFQLELLIPFVSQFRQIIQNNGDLNEEGGFGLGDITLMPQFEIVSAQFSTLIIGFGLKLPTGANDVRNKDGFLLINDLQLGTNSYDYLLRASFSHVLSVRPSASLYANGTLIYNGTNNSYLGSEQYKFGNEFQLNIGVSDQLFTAKSIVYPSVSFRLRQSIRDQINHNQINNTGGTWVFGKIGIGVDLLQYNRISFTAEYPLFTNVDGTQLSPDYILNFSFYKKIDLTPTQ